MVTRSAFAAAVLKNAATVTHYESGASGPGGCDCIGLIIGALRLLGVKWPGTHGTNWTARNYVTGLQPFSGLGALNLGDVVFKAREPGEPKYNLPPAYKDSPDQRDYYHVGTVTAVNPIRITHCTTVPGGIATDTKQGTWEYKALLKCVSQDSGGGGKPVGKIKIAIVTTPDGTGVNFRTEPRKADNVIKKIPDGEEVEVLEEQGTWDKIEYKGETGYAMSEFLLIVGEKDDDPPAEIPPEEIPPEDTEPQGPEDGDTIQVPLNLIISLRAAAQNFVDLCDAAINNG